jgi:TRAP-type C4-dicarboxylate transport system substrate-binding protein
LRAAGIMAPRCHTLLDQLTFRSAIVLSADRRATSRPQKAQAAASGDLPGENAMQYGKRAHGRAVFAAGILAFAATLPLGVAHAQDKQFVMKISAPTLNAVPDTYGRNLAAAIEKDSGGRIKVEVYPASQLGSIPRQIEGTQFGAIQMSVLPPEFFVGIDERFEIMAAPGLIQSLPQGQRLAADPAVQKLILGLGANKGLRGLGLMVAEGNEIIARSPIRHLADFKGKKLRIFASDFQSVALQRLGGTPVAMTLGDVLPAIQQGAIDGAYAGVQVFTGMHFYDAAKSVTLVDQPTIFLVAEANAKWLDSLPADLREIVVRDAAAQAVAINPVAMDILEKAHKGWTEHGGELIKLPPDEQAKFLDILSSVGEDVSQKKPAVHEAYEAVKQAAQRLK